MDPLMEELPGFMVTQELNFEIPFFSEIHYYPITEQKYICQILPAY